MQDSIMSLEAHAMIANVPNYESRILYICLLSFATSQNQLKTGKIPLA